MKLTKLVEDLYQQMTGKTDDHEVEMAITDLRSLAHRAAALADHFEKERTSDLEGWVQAKITKASDYIGAVYDNHMFSPDQECDSCGDGLNESSTSTIFTLVKPYTNPDAGQLKAKADKLIETLRSKGYISISTDSVLYFPNFTWGGGKYKYGPSLGILAGSNTVVVSPIDSGKLYNIQEALLARFVKDGRLEAYTLAGDINEASSTCCGKCGHYHVKGTACPKPYLTGKRHCRNRPR